MDAIFGFHNLGDNWNYIRTLEQNGYTANGGNEEYNRAAVLEKLEELCESETVSEERILWWEREGSEDADEEVFLVYPVTLALLLEKYDYAESLLKKGYEVEYVLPDKQIYYRKNGTTGRAYAIHRTQVLMTKDTIPEELLVSIYRNLSVVCPVFSFQEDIWDNPFLSHEVDEAVRHSLPAMYGLEKIHAEHTQWLEGMLADDAFSKDKLVFLPANIRRKLMYKLLKFFRGMGEDLAQYIEIFAPQLETMNPCRESRDEVKYWMKLLPALEEACCQDEISQRAFFESQVTIMGNLPRTKQFLDESLREEIGEELMKVVRRSRPEDYTIEDYLIHVNRKKKPEEYGRYMKLWKRITGERLVLDWMGATLWDMLEKIFGDKQKFSPNDRTDRQEERLLWGITFMESVDEMVAEEERDGGHRDSDVLTQLVCILIDFESEELFLACLKNKFLPKDAIGACIKSALKFQKLRVIPALIFAKNQG